jgi:formylglycine-generating enzyme required for sulfatase activity
MVWESNQDVSHRIGRGSSWHKLPNNCRSAVRLKFDPAKKDEFFGFRVALSTPIE